MAIRFPNAGTSYIQSSDTFTPPTVGTVCLWFMPTAVTGSQRLIGSDGSWEIRINNSLELVGDFYAGTGVTSIITLSDDVLYHGVFTYDAVTNIEVFIDGQSDNSKTVVPGAIDVDLLSIGTRTGSTGYFFGVLDDVRIYDRILSDGEIETIYEAQGNDNIIDGMLHRWTFEEGAPGPAGAIIDLTGALNMSGTNSPTWESSELTFKKVL